MAFVHKKKLSNWRSHRNIFKQQSKVILTQQTERENFEHKFIETTMQTVFRNRNKKVIEL